MKVFNRKTELSFEVNDTVGSILINKKKYKPIDKPVDIPIDKPKIKSMEIKSKDKKDD